MSINFIVGDCLASLRKMRSDTFDCIVTSPPYWDLRNYGGGKVEVGMEQTVGAYLKKMVDVCRELRRVLKPSGTFWLNIGDSYASKSNGSIKAKDLCLIPNHLILMLRKDGWYVRSEIIWHKPNPKPEPTRDRPTSAHEKVWLLTKSSKYFYDYDAVSVKAATPPSCTGIRSIEKTQSAKTHQLNDPNRLWGSEKRNIHNVWVLGFTPNKIGHGAMMPTTLAERCIKAGCPVGGRVLDPFGGAGTTGLAADRLGQHCTLLELNPKYVEMAKQRIIEDRRNRKLRKKVVRPVYNKPTRSLLATFKRRQE